jgi:hypothetical protein
MVWLKLTTWEEEHIKYTLLRFIPVHQVQYYKFKLILPDIATKTTGEVDKLRSFKLRNIHYF